MGLYDEVMIPCPECGEKYYAQSKGGFCTMTTYDINEAPADVMSDVNRHAPFICEKCGTSFKVDIKYYYQIIET